MKNLPINKKTGKILDMYRLYAAMTSKGGSSKVVKDKKMKFVTSYMGFAHTSEIASALKIIYRKYFYAFEQKAMFQRDIPIVRNFPRFFSSRCTQKHDIPQVKNELKPKTIFAEPSRIVTFDVTSEKKREVDFQDLYDALKSSKHERNLWALKSLLRITTLQECGGEPVSMPGSVRSVEGSLMKSSIFFHCFTHSYESQVRKTPLAMYSKLAYLSFVERPEFLDVLVSSPYLESLVESSVPMSTNSKDDFDDSSCSPTLCVQTTSQILTLQILNILKNLTYDVQNQKVAAQHLSLIRT